MGQKGVQNECVVVTQNPAFQCQQALQGKCSFGSGPNSVENSIYRDHKKKFHEFLGPGYVCVLEAIIT